MEQEKRKAGEEIIKELKLKALNDKCLRLLNQLASQLMAFDFWFPRVESESGGYSEQVCFDPDLGFDYELIQEFRRDFAIFIREWYLDKTIEYEKMAKDTLKQLSNQWN